MSHIATVLSPEPEQKTCEKGWNCTEFTESTWPRKVNLLRDMFMSHNFTVWSIEHDSRKSPVSW